MFSTHFGNLSVDTFVRRFFQNLPEVLNSNDMSEKSSSRLEARISIVSNDPESERRLRDRWNAFVAESTKELDFDLKVNLKKSFFRFIDGPGPILKKTFYGPNLQIS